MLRKTMDKANVSVLCFMGKVMNSQKGASTVVEVIGLSAVAVAVAVVLFTKFPVQTDAIMTKIFAKLSTGLGLE